MKNKPELTKNKYQLWINVVSIAIPIVVALLFMVRIPNVEPLSFLPPIYASINGITAFLLIFALIAIKNKKRVLHENLMKTAIMCSLLFLVMYVAYHMTMERIMLLLQLGNRSTRILEHKKVLKQYLKQEVSIKTKIGWFV